MLLEDRGQRGQRTEIMSESQSLANKELKGSAPHRSPK